jgi:hypothetical protein
MSIATPDLRDLVYLGEGSRTEMSKLQTVLMQSGVPAVILPVRACSTHT